MRYSYPQTKTFAILVDKVIIAQDPLKRFINAICPGSYASVTKVDFKTLDNFMIKPLGVYGSKVEIVRFLRSLGAVNEDMCVNIPFFIKAWWMIRPLVLVYYFHRLSLVIPDRPYHLVCTSWQPSR